MPRAPPHELVAEVSLDYRGAELEPRTRALCDFAAKLTRAPATISAGDVEALRGHGLEDDAISDAIQVVGYFNYVNRVADGVGIEDEPDWA